MASKLGARKNGSFKAVSTAPSINKTPMGNSTPPLPYPVTEDLGSSTGTVPNVRFNGDPAYVLDQSTQPNCKGDAAGSAKGVKSGTTGGEVKPVQGSSSVRIGGKPVIRDGDPCTLNGGNCPGLYVTQPAPGAAIKGGAPTASGNPPVKPDTPAEANWWSEASPWVHGALGVASFVPGLSIVTGAADAAIFAAEGNLAEAALSAASMIPGGKIATTAGKAVKGAANMGKGAKAASEGTQAVKAADATGDVAKTAKATARNAAQTKKTAAPTGGGGGKGNNGTKIKGTGKKRTGEKGKCGEFLARQDMHDQGFDEVVSVQNNSGHGVDLIGRNSKTGEVKVWEVKTTDGTSAPSLSKAQAELGGEKFTEDRLERAANGKGNYRKVPAAMENAQKVEDWIEDANGKVSYEKREVFVDDLDKGCTKHPNRPSKSEPWLPKK